MAGGGAEELRSGGLEVEEGREDPGAEGKKKECAPG